MMVSDVKLRFLEWQIDLHKNVCNYDLASDDSAFEDAIKETWDYILHCHTYDSLTPKITPRINRLIQAFTKAASLYEEGVYKREIDWKTYSKWVGYYRNFFRWVNDIERLTLHVDHIDSHALKKLGYGSMEK